MKKLQGNWNYQSFTASAGVVDRSTIPPEIKVPPLIAAPWTPPSVMTFQTNMSGAITGSATLGAVEFDIRGSITSALAWMPAGMDLEGVELAVTVGAASAEYRLRGYFLPNSDHIIGTVVCLGNDLAYRPDGTAGPFVLYPA